MQYRCYVIMNISWHPTMNRNRITDGYWLNSATEVITWCLYILCHANLKWNLSAVFAKHCIVLNQSKPHSVNLNRIHYSSMMVQRKVSHSKLRIKLTYQIWNSQSCPFFLFWALRHSAVWAGIAWMCFDFVWAQVSSSSDASASYLCLTASSSLWKCGVN